MIELLRAVAGIVVMTWTFSGLLILWGVRYRVLRTLWAELRPFYLPAVAIAISHHVLTGTMVGWNSLYDAFALLNWWLFKDVDDDDRWKRRRAKLVEKLERRGARLVAVPVRAS